MFGLGPDWDFVAAFSSERLPGTDGVDDARCFKFGIGSFLFQATYSGWECPVIKVSFSATRQTSTAMMVGTSLNVFWCEGVFGCFDSMRISISDGMEDSKLQISGSNLMFSRLEIRNCVVA